MAKKIEADVTTKVKGKNFNLYCLLDILNPQD